MPAAPTPSPLDWRAPSAQQLARVASHLAAGGLAVVPTESTYGLVASALSAAAVARLIALKGRAAGHALPLVAGSYAQVERITQPPLPATLVPLRALWPAPLTLALPAAAHVPAALLAADGTLGVRIPEDEALRALCLALGAPLVATSANLSGAPAAYTLRALAPQIAAATLQLDGGELPLRPPSTVIAARAEGTYAVLREGPVPQAHIDALCAPVAPEQLVCDALGDGELQLWQPARHCGYRFNLDAVLLAAFAQPHLPQDGRLLELGAGCGVVSLWLFARGHVGPATAVERQPLLAQAVARNIVAHNLVGRLRLWPGDLRGFAAASPADVVLFNPPYQPAHRGRPSHEPGRDAARRELHGELADFVRVAAASVAERGVLAAIVPHWRGAELRALAAAAGFARTASQPVLARAGQEPTRLLCLMRRGAAADTPLAPLVTHEADGRHLTPAVARWVSRA